MVNMRNLSVDFNGNYVDENNEIIQKKIPSGNYSLQVWGDLNNGGTLGVPPIQHDNIKKVYSNNGAFAALTNNGNVIVWGNPNSGGFSPFINGIGLVHDNTDATDLLSNVVEIYHTSTSFAALKSDGTIFAWGNINTDLDHYIKDGQNKLSNVKNIYATSDSYAALLNDGTVFVWGDNTTDYIYDGINKLSNVNKIYCTDGAFAAKLNNGKVFIWGDSNFGGSYIFNDNTKKGYVYENNNTTLLTNVVKIFSTEQAFAALLNNGRIFVWGHPNFGGSNVYDPNNINNQVAINNPKTYFGYIYDGNGKFNVNGNNIITGIKKIFSTNSAFAAVDADGAIFIWGNNNFGGTYRGSGRGYIKVNDTERLLNIKTITSNQFAFAALTEDNDIVTWGGQMYGGSGSYDSQYQGFLYEDYTLRPPDEGQEQTGDANGINIFSGAIKIISSGRAFAALKSDGSVFVWGDPEYGGTQTFITTNPPDYAAILASRGYIKSNNNIIYNFTDIYSTESAFAAVKSNGDIITWGNQDNGGDLHTWGLDFNIDPPQVHIPVVPTTITGNYLKFIVATFKAFCEMTQTSNNNSISIYRATENIDLENIKKYIPLELLKYAIYNNIQIYLE